VRRMWADHYFFCAQAPVVVLLFWELFFDRVAELCSESETSEGFCPQAFSFMSWVFQKKRFELVDEFQVRSGACLYFFSLDFQLDCFCLFDRM